MNKGEWGATLVEVVIAIAILGIVGVAIFGALSGSSKAVITSDERTTAESLARAEMEYIVSHDYVGAPWSYRIPGTPPSWDLSHTLTGYPGYSIDVSAAALSDNGTVRSGIEKIMVTVSRSGRPILTSANSTLEGYRTE